MLDADGQDDPACQELLVVTKGKLEPVSSFEHAGDEDLLDLQVQVGLEPLAVVDEILQRYRQPIALIRMARRLAEGLQRVGARGVGEVRGEALGLQVHPLRHRLAP